MDEDLIEKKITGELVYDGRLLKVSKDTVRLPSGNTTTREWIHHPGAVAIVPVLDDGRIVMVRQYRYPIHRVTLELPAGKLDNEESPEECAVRELKEETGYVCKQLRYLTTIATTVGFSDEVIHLYAAENLVADRACPDEDEFINAITLTRAELDSMIMNGEIQDAKTVAALLFWQRLTATGG